MKNQYQHTGIVSKPVKPIVEAKMTYMEQQMMETVRRLALLTDQQGRQIRRLENELDMIRESVNRQNRG